MGVYGPTDYQLAKANLGTSGRAIQAIQQQLYALNQDARTPDETKRAVRANLRLALAEHDRLKRHLAIIETDLGMR